MQNLRRYGSAPYTVAVIHGGPGAAGEMAPVARELAPGGGVLEPLQTAASLEGQVEELRDVLKAYAAPPVSLVGFSWGAWLGFLVGARYPTLVRKLILVGSGGFEESYTAGLRDTRLSRLGDAERAEVRVLLNQLEEPGVEGNQEDLARVGALLSRADAYDPLPPAAASPNAIEVRAEVFQGVWPQAAELRRSGRLLALGSAIQCPVVAIHGDYDPHPADGVEQPLSSVVRDFRFILLKRCGHRPWIERQARDEFYRVLREELD